MQLLPPRHAIGKNNTGTLRSVQAPFWRDVVAWWCAWIAADIAQICANFEAKKVAMTRSLA
jgi:hypothetical protein